MPRLEIKRRSLSILGASAVLMLSAPAMAEAAVPCRGAELVPTADNLPAVRSALLCLHNHARAGQGLPPLREHRTLRNAAGRHARAMVRSGTFESGNFTRRLLATRYGRDRDRWTFGENLAWGVGELATPSALMAAWLRTASSRRALLDRAFRDVGIGIALGVPEAKDVGMTFTVDFGGRRPA